MRAQLLLGKTTKQEVEGWIQDVEKLNDEIESIEREAGEGKCFSRAPIEKLAFEKIREVEELYQMGAFTDSLVIDPPPSNGEIMSTPTLIGESTAERVKEEIWACMLDDDVRKIGLYGMEGIGKSTIIEHIDNRLSKEKNKFDSVIWVTVSKSLNVIQLQHDIARKLDLDLAKVDDIYKKMFVKMHNLVRDMVLDVASPQFMVEGCLGLEDFTDKGKWRENLVKASLMYKDISTIPPNVLPRYPNLLTLLLQGNWSLKNVSDSLFEHLYGLKVLDLSYTGIESLPNSVCSLEKLTTLRLRWCIELEHVSSLAKLTTLRKLDLRETQITKVPNGLEMLVNLKFLDLNAHGLKSCHLGFYRKSLIYSTSQFLGIRRQQ